MALKIKIDPVERFTEAIVRNDLSLPEQRREIATFVNAGLEEAKQTNRMVLGRVPPYITTVDGRINAPFESVNPNGGNIVIEFELITEVLIWIARTLEERSPVVSGDYKRGHMVFADGRQTEIGDNLPPAEEYIFVNFVPYARKIEIGKTQSGRDFVIQVPNRIYELTARDARARFGNQAKISYFWQSTSGGAIGAWAQTGSARRHAARIRGGSAKHHNAWLTRQPAISVRIIDGLRSSSRSR